MYIFPHIALIYADNQKCFWDKSCRENQNTFDVQYVYPEVVPLMG
jgi:hypothetical protein